MATEVYSKTMSLNAIFNFQDFQAIHLLDTIFAQSIDLESPCRRTKTVLAATLLFPNHNNYCAVQTYLLFKR